MKKIIFALLGIVVLLAAAGPASAGFSKDPKDFFVIQCDNPGQDPAKCKGNNDWWIFGKKVPSEDPAVCKESMADVEVDFWCDDNSTGKMALSQSCESVPGCAFRCRVAQSKYSDTIFKYKADALYKNAIIDKEVTCEHGLKVISFSEGNSHSSLLSVDQIPSGQDSDDGVPVHLGGALFDNCPKTPNWDQKNADNDTHGNVCDNCMNIDNEDQADSDGIGVGDACQQLGRVEGYNFQRTNPQVLPEMLGRLGIVKAIPSTDPDDYTWVKRYAWDGPGYSPKTNPEKWGTGKQCGNGSLDGMCRKRVAAPDAECSDDYVGLPCKIKNLIGYEVYGKLTGTVNQGHQGDQNVDLKGACVQTDKAFRSDAYELWQISASGTPYKIEGSQVELLRDCVIRALLPMKAGSKEYEGARIYFQEVGGYNKRSPELEYKKIKLLPDEDEDGVADGSDNCKRLINFDQEDQDGNGIGDGEIEGGPKQGCELDVDYDTMPDDYDQSGVKWENPCTGGKINYCDDNCPYVPNPDQADADENGIGDACEQVTKATGPSAVIKATPVQPAAKNLAPAQPAAKKPAPVIKQQTLAPVKPSQTLPATKTPQTTRPKAQPPAGQFKIVR